MTDIFINGEWRFGDGAGFESLCPATDESVWQGHEATKDQVDDAIASARAAQPKWAATPLAERIEILERYAENLTADKENIAYAISRDMGKPLWEALTEVGAMSAKIGHSIRARWRFLARLIFRVTSRMGILSPLYWRGTRASLNPLNSHLLLRAI